MLKEFRQEQILAVAILNAVLLCIVVDARSAYGYNEDGHFYTVTAVEHDRETPFQNGSRDEAVLTAFCAQLPDLANQLDAITLRVEVIPSFGGQAWGFFGGCFSEDVRHMAAVHQYLHGLTDSPAQPVTESAVAIIKELRGEEEKNPDPNTACAVGFAIHLLGDSFAHRQLHGSTDRTYPPGMGHYYDNHDPDYIDFSEDRMKLWEAYTKTLADALGISFDQSRWDDLWKVAETNIAGGTENNLFNTREIIKGLRATLNDNGGIAVWAKYVPPLENLTASDSLYRQHVLSRDFNDVVVKYMPPHYRDLTYEKVWRTYEATAVSAFGNEHISAACPPDSMGPQ